VTSVTLGLDEDVTCTFVNDDKAPSLTLVKEVTNDNGGTAVPGDWTLTATGYDADSPDAGSYDLSESGGPTGYTQTSLTCDNSGDTQVTSVTLGLDEDVTCTFVNDDGKATPDIATDVDARIRDNVTITGRGTPSGTVDFRLYTDSACEELFGEDLGVTLVGGSATSDWFDISASGTYFWQIEYSGDQNNEARTGDCDEEIDITSDHFDPVAGGAAIGFALPILAWALWSRRRRENAN
jgi:hypothetical protein